MKKFKRLVFLLIVLVFALFCEHCYKTLISQINTRKSIEQLKNFERQKKYNLLEKINPSDFYISETGCNFLVHDLEGSKFVSKTLFIGSGDVVSIGAEYVFKKEDLYNQGVFYKSGFKIEDYCSLDFLKFLKKKFKYYNKQIVLKLNKNEIKYWTSKNIGIRILTQEESKNLFKSYIHNDILALQKIIKVDLYQWEIDAIIFALYNMGFYTLKKSGFFKTLNNMQRNEAAYVLASIRQIRINDKFPNVWKNGEIKKSKFLEFIHTHNNLDFKPDLKVLKKIFIHKKSLEKNLLKISKEEDFKIFSLFDKQNIKYLDDLNLADKTKSDLLIILNSKIYLDEISYLLQLKKIQDKLIYSFWIQRFSILDFIFKVIIHLFSKNNDVWKGNKISLNKLLIEATSYRKFLKHFYGWCKRDFIHANIFCNSYKFNKNMDLSIDKNLKNTNEINYLTNFFHLLSEGYHKNWIFDCKKQGIEIMYKKYISALNKEYNVNNETVSRIE